MSLTAPGPRPGARPATERPAPTRTTRSSSPARRAGRVNTPPGARWATRATPAARTGACCAAASCRNASVVLAGVSACPRCGHDHHSRPRGNSAPPTVMAHRARPAQRVDRWRQVPRRSRRTRSSPSPPPGCCSTDAASTFARSPSCFSIRWDTVRRHRHRRPAGHLRAAHHRGALVSLGASTWALQVAYLTVHTAERRRDLRGRRSRPAGAPRPALTRAARASALRAVIGADPDRAAHPQDRNRSAACRTRADPGPRPPISRSRSMPSAATHRSRSSSSTRSGSSRSCASPGCSTSPRWPRCGRSCWPGTRPVPKRRPRTTLVGARVRCCTSSAQA